MCFSFWLKLMLCCTFQRLDLFLSDMIPSSSSSVIKPDQMLVPDTVFFASEEKSGARQEEMEDVEKQEEQTKYNRQRCNSDSVLRATNPEEIRRGHKQLCIRRAEAVKQRGVSLLNEVDAQYSALQVGCSQHIEVKLKTKKK